MSGIIINIDPVIFQVGSFALRWYSLAFMSGIALATIIVINQAKKQGLDTGKVANVALWAVLGGLIGARLFHVLDRLDYYAANPRHIIMINEGGMAIWGGLVSGGLVALFVAHREKLPIPKLADITSVGLLVGQMIGRLGCIVTGDTLGRVTSMPWGFIYVNPGSAVPDSLKGVPTHPYPVYEILWDLALLGLILFLRRRRLPQGLLFLVYVGGYALGRFGLTFVRQEAVTLWGLQQAQVIALAIFTVAVVAAVGLITKAGQAPRPAASKRMR